MSSDTTDGAGYDENDTRKVIENVRLEILSVLDDIFKRSSDVRPSYNLGHYTTGPGLIGIIESRIIHCTNIRYLNDASEFEYGISLLEQVASPIGRMPGRSGKVAYYALNTPNLDMASLARLGINQLGREYYVACFSEDSNQLGQWRAYSGGLGGYCLEFGARHLQALATGHGASLRRCIYDEDEQMEMLLHFLHSVMTRSIEPALEGRAPPAKQAIENTVGYFLRNALAGLFQVFKHPSFREEQEWRLIKAPQTAEEFSARKFKPKTELIVPYIEFDLTRENSGWDVGLIPRIVVGPNRHPELAAASLKHFLHVNQLSEVDIVPPTIPYRPLG